MTKNKELKINLTLKDGSNFTGKYKENTRVCCIKDNSKSSNEEIYILFRNNLEILCDVINFSKCETVLPAVILTQLFDSIDIKIEEGRKYSVVDKIDIVGQKDRLLWKNKILDTCHKFCPSLTVNVTDDGEKIEIVIVTQKTSPSDDITIEDNKMTLVFDRPQIVEHMLLMDALKCTEITLHMPNKFSELEEQKLYDELIILLDVLTAPNNEISISVVGAKLEFQQRYMRLHPLNPMIVMHKIAHPSISGRYIFKLTRHPTPSPDSSSN